MKSRLWLKIFGILILVLLTASCDLLNDGLPTDEEGALTVEEVRSISTEWTDENDSQLSFVELLEDPGKYYLDIGWYTDPENTDTWIMGFIEEDAYTVSGSTLAGVYTSFQNGEGNDEVPYDITIEFSYADDVLTAVIDANGILGNKTLQLVAVPSPVEE